MIFWIIMILIIILLIFVAKTIWLVWFNPITFINIVYLIWEALGRIGYMGQYVPTYDSSIFILINILIINIFIIVGFGLPRIEIGNYKNNSRSYIVSKNKSRNVLLLTRIICLIINLSISINLLKMLLSGSLLITSIRQLSYSTSYGSKDYIIIFFNTGIYYFYQYFIRGFAFFDLSFSLVLLIKSEKKISLITIINFALWAFIMLSRVEILKAVILCGIIICLSDVKLNKKQKKVLKRAIFFLLIAVAIIFSFRSINKEKNVIFNSIDSLIIDFSGSNYMFSSFFNQYFTYGAVEDVPYCLKILGGFGTIVEYVIAIIFGYYFDHDAANKFLTQGHNIGSSDHYNAFYTMFFDPLNTGGVLGCVIFSILLGLIVGVLYKKFFYDRGARDLYMVSYFTYVIVMGTYNYTITVAGAVVILFAMLYPQKK